jgi:hypothetical protein
MTQRKFFSRLAGNIKMQSTIKGIFKRGLNALRLVVRDLLSLVCAL